MSKEEKEIKIELNIPLDVFLMRLEGLGFEKKKEITQRDNYFDTEDWRLYKNVAALRTRQVNGVDHSFAFKKVFGVPNRDNNRYVEEIEGRFPSQNNAELKSIFNRLGIENEDCNALGGDSLAEILNRNGFQGEQIMTKTRQAFCDSQKNEIVIDDVDRVGTIIELECENSNPMDVIKDLLRNDEWMRSTVGTSYAWLEKVKGFIDHLEYEKRFEQNPDWNVWDNEREMYDNLISPWSERGEPPHV